MTPKPSKNRKNRPSSPRNLTLNKAKILGVGVNSTSYDRVLDWISQKIARHQKSYLVTPNPEMLIAAQKDKHFQKILNQAGLALPDGYGLVLASHFLNTRPQITTTVTGTDLMEKLIPLAVSKNWRVFFLGGEEMDVAQKTAEKFAATFQLPSINFQFSPGPQKLKIQSRSFSSKIKTSPTKIKTSSPSVSQNYQLKIGDPQVNQETIKKINRFRPHLLFVAFGHPKQEYWIDQFLPQLKVNCAVGVGGAFDYFAGTTPRAPLFIRKIHFEWLFRLLIQPSRYRRIFTALVIFPLLILKSHLNQTY